MKKSKKFLCLFFLLSLLFLLYSCVSSPEKVKLASEKQILQYAEEKFGKASVAQVSHGENSITYTMSDGEYGFRYSIKSYADKFDLDGTTFGYYEQKLSDFSTYYQMYIASKVTDEFHLEQLNIDLKESKYDTIKTFILDIKSNHLDIDTVEKIGKRTDEIDTRDFFADFSIEVIQNETHVGCYSFKYKQFLTPEEEDIYWYMDTASYILKTNDITYVRHERILKENVIGLNECNIAHVLGENEDDYTDLYYFISNGHHYFIAQQCIVTENGNVQQYIHQID